MRNHPELDEKTIAELMQGASEFMKKRRKKQQTCSERGHSDEEKVIGVEYLPRAVAYVLCPECEATYERPLNREEQKQMQEELTILVQ